MHAGLLLHATLSHPRDPPADLHMFCGVRSGTAGVVRRCVLPLRNNNVVDDDNVIAISADCRPCCCAHDTAGRCADASTTESDTQQNVAVCDDEY